METAQHKILDVTTLNPKEKHPTIFRLFDALPEGETLVILNDHDPKPLYYQLINERGNIFDWEYEQTGPDWWQVRITKSASPAGRATVGEIVAGDFRKAEVFKKYGIDFCCGGKKTVEEVCEEMGLDAQSLQRELDQASETGRGQRNLDYARWSADFLADYIVNTHHTYVNEALPEIRQYAAKVAEVHGANHPELTEVSTLVESLNAELTNHMMKEERILFPYIREIVRAQKEGRQLQAVPFGTVEDPIHMMEDEHDAAGVILRQLREVTNDYRLPVDACVTYSLLFSMLQEFEEDLHTHIHLENNILFPKAIELERAALH